MRALASNLEASRTFEAPFPLKIFEPNVDLGPKAPPLPLTTGIPRLSPLNALRTPPRRPKTGLDRRR
jgi:hypothetical protein